MTVLASDVMDRAASFLNDAARELYSYTVQLPFLEAANDELGDELSNHGIALQKKIGTYISYVNSTSETSLTLPSDLIVPVTLWERTSTSEDFAMMDRKAWESGITQQSTRLNYWVWRDQKIYVPPCSQDLQLRLDYIRILTAISAAGSTVEVFGATNFLAYKTAELCARSIGGNEVVGDKMEVKANKHLNRLLGTGIKSNQVIRPRRRPFRINPRWRMM